jgi:translation elongation factor P/translation initiation factor 5A
MSDEEFHHEDDANEDSGSGALNVQSCELGECKELQQPAPLQSTLCRKNTFVILKDCPCKIADLKVSKTGKHGSAKCNMVGYDIITGKKYQETVPGHATMFGFSPAKMEYEVADISGSQITAMTSDGEERFFQVPDTEIGTKLVADFKANAEKGGDQFFLITVLYAPRMVGKNWQANMFVEAYKQGKAE